MLNLVIFCLRKIEKGEEKRNNYWVWISQRIFCLNKYFALAQIWRLSRVWKRGKNSGTRISSSKYFLAWKFIELACRLTGGFLLGNLFWPNTRDSLNHLANQQERSCWLKNMSQFRIAFQAAITNNLQFTLLKWRMHLTCKFVRFKLQSRADFLTDSKKFFSPTFV